MSEPFLELTSQPLFRVEHGRALHLEVVLLSVVRLKLGRRHLAELALRLRLGLSLLLPRREIALPLRVRVDWPAAPLWRHVIGGALPLRCEAKLPLRVRLDLRAAPMLAQWDVPRPGPRTQKSVPRSLTGGLAQQPSRVARLLALLCTLLQPRSLRSLTALGHEGIIVLDDVVT